MKQYRQYRHGDVFLREIEMIPQGATLKARHGDLVLAYGEKTGHAHVIAEPSVREFIWEKGRYIEVLSPSDLDHEEHGVITLPPGKYEVIQQREWTLADEWRQILD